MSTISVTCERILERINNEKPGTFTSSDFSDIDNYKMIRQKCANSQNTCANIAHLYFTKSVINDILLLVIL